MAEKETKKKQEIGLVRISQETGVGIQLPNGEVIDMSTADIGTVQAFAYIISALDDLKKNLG